jgi:predicted RNA-binding protein with PUA-like domain
MNYWLVKQEPEDFSWADFVKDGGAAWTGVRNYQARNNHRGMKKGEVTLFYHSGDAKEVVGLAKVKREAYADATAEEGDWSAVDLVPVTALKKAVTLAVIKADRELKDIGLVRNSRLSVMPLTEAQFKRVLALADTAV